MCNSKVIRSLSLLLFFSLLLTGFGSVNVSAAENLVESDLTQWENLYPENTTVAERTRVTTSVTESCYHIMSTYTIIDGTVTDGTAKVSCVYDLTSLTAGNSYTFSFDLLSLSQAQKFNGGLNEDNYYGGLITGDGVYYIGLASYNSSSEDFEIVENACISITKDNYLDYYGRTNTISFVMPNMVNPCIVIGYVEISTNYYYQNVCFQNISLVNNDETKEEAGFSRLFEWFQEKFDDIGDSFSNLGNKLSTGFTNLGDRIKTFFSDLGTSISKGLNSVKEGIQNKLEEVKTSLVELREGLINGIKGLFIPDEDFISGWKSRIELLLQEHLGIVWEAANFFTDLFSTVSDLLSDTENGSLEFVFPGVEFELLGHNFDLWEERAVDMSFLETDSFWSFWYGLYKIILVIILCFALVLYGYNTLEGKLRR